MNIYYTKNVSIETVTEVHATSLVQATQLYAEFDNSDIEFITTNKGDLVAEYKYYYDNNGFPMSVDLVAEVKSQKDTYSSIVASSIGMCEYEGETPEESVRMSESQQEIMAQACYNLIGQITDAYLTHGGGSDLVKFDEVLAKYTK